MAKHSFCNINREHDAVTIYINREFRTKLKGRTLGYAVKQMLFCRIFNEPETLKLACPLEDLTAAKAAIAHRHASGLKIFRGAYIMPAHEGKGGTGLDYWFRAIEDIERVEFGGLTKLADVAERMMTVKGVGEFVANQVCADLRYAPGFSFDDWGEFVLCGPGTRRGLNRLADRPTRDHLKSAQAVTELLAIRQILARELNPREAAHFNDPNNVANSLCEFDKYERYQTEGGSKLKKYGRNKNAQTELV